MKLEAQKRVYLALYQRFSYQLRLSPPPFWALWSGLSLDRCLMHYGPARQVSTRSHFWASLGISILKPSPNLSSFRLIVSNQIGNRFTVLKSELVTVVVLSSASI